MSIEFTYFLSISTLSRNWRWSARCHFLLFFAREEPVGIFSFRLVLINTSRIFFHLFLHSSPKINCMYTYKLCSGVYTLIWRFCSTVYSVVYYRVVQKLWPILYDEFHKDITNFEITYGATLEIAIPRW